MPIPTPHRLAIALALALTPFACAGSSGSSAAPAGQGGPVDPEPQSFTAQVELGHKLYGEACASCHGAAGEGGRAPRVVGLAEGALPLDPPEGAKKRTSQFVTVADVGTFVIETMPPGRPGKFTTEQYLAILAFDLKANGIDLGEEKLTLEKAAELTIPR